MEFRYATGNDLLNNYMEQDGLAAQRITARPALNKSPARTVAAAILKKAVFHTLARAGAIMLCHFPGRSFRCVLGGGPGHDIDGRVARCRSAGNTNRALADYSIQENDLLRANTFLRNLERLQTRLNGMVAACNSLQLAVDYGN
jgi:hypothetical protein